MFKVLIADDSPQVVAYLAGRFRTQDDLNLDVAHVATADRFLSAVDEVRPDIILLDVIFEGEETDGVALCRELRSAGHSMPVIFMTVKDFSDERIVSQYLRGGADRIIVKRDELAKMQRRAGYPPAAPAGSASLVNGTYLWPTKGRDFEHLMVEVRRLLTGPATKLPAAPAFEVFNGGDLRVTPEGLAAGELQVRDHHGWRRVPVSGSQQKILECLLLEKSGSDGRGRVHRDVLRRRAGLSNVASLQSQISKLRQKFSAASGGRAIEVIETSGNGEWYRFAGGV
jgi:DNA-binding response OmpR family regulator